MLSIPQRPGSAPETHVAMPHISLGGFWILSWPRCKFGETIPFEIKKIVQLKSQKGKLRLRNVMTKIIYSLCNLNFTFVKLCFICLFFFFFCGDVIYKVKYCMDECNPLNGLWTHSSRECYKFTTEC